jgi:hypothetical protein
VSHLRRAGRKSQTRLYVSRLWRLGRKASGWLQVFVVRPDGRYPQAKLPLPKVLAVRLACAPRNELVKINLGRHEGIISPHGRRHPRASRGAEVRDCRNPEAKSSVFPNAQTGLERNERSRKTRTEIEENHGRIKLNDGLEGNLRIPLLSRTGRRLRLTACALQHVAYFSRQQFPRKRFVEKARLTHGRGILPSGRL